MTNEIITMVYPANILPIWESTAELLKPAIELNDTHSVEDVRKMALCGNTQLWIQWSDKVDAAVVTEFVNYPKGVWFRFWLAGARKGAEVLWEKFFDTLVAFAKANNCHGIEDCGRIGWNKYCPEQVKMIGTVRRMNFGNG